VAGKTVSVGTRSFVTGESLVIPPEVGLYTKLNPVDPYLESALVSIMPFEPEM
jgi:hypothetical protein